MRRLEAVPQVFLLAILLVGATGHRPGTSGQDPLPLLGEPGAEDQLFNANGSAPTVFNSIVQGGLSDGTVDGGGNQFSEVRLGNLLGADGAVGTLDDDLTPTGTSVAVDAGTNSALPPDRFDLDGDGDTAEPLPVDRAGNQRAYDGGLGSTTTDIGAFEYGSPSATGVSGRSSIPFDTYLSEPYPNPAGDSFNLQFGVRSSTVARITVYDALGRQIATAFDQHVVGGRENRVHVSTATLASGVYYIKLTAGSMELNRHFVLAR